MLKDTFKKNKNVKFAILFFTILIGIRLRVHYALNNAYFVNDQGRDLMILQNMLERGYPITIGPSTSFFTKYGNIPFGPYYYYFLFPFFLISKHPYFITLVFITLFSLIAFWILKLKNLSFMEKLIFLLLFSFSLNSIYHTTFIWNLNLAMLLGFLTFLFFLQKKEWILASNLRTFVFSLALGAIFQIHYALFFLLAGIGIKIAKENVKKLFPFLLGFFTSFFPFVIFEIRHNFLITKMFLQLPLETRENNLRINLVQTFIDLSQFYFPFLIKFKTLHLLIGTLLSLFLIAYPKRFSTKLFFSLFIITFVLFRRNFVYYLALYLPFFYFQVATATRKKKIQTFFLILALITTGYSFNRFLKEKNFKFGIKTQIAIAKKIMQHNEDKSLSLTAYPHPDDKKGVEYLLSVVYKFKIDDKDKDKYIICYEKNLCQNKKTIWKGEKVKLVYFRK